MRRALLSLIAVALLELVMPAGAAAHVGKPPSPALVAPPQVSTAVLHAAAPAASSVALVLGLAAGVLATFAIRWRPRRVLAVVLAVLIAVFAVEAGIHSVHHLGDHAAAACAVAAAAGHLALCLDGGPPVVTLPLTPTGAAADEHLASPAAPGLGPDLARAPPAPIA